MEAAVQTMSSQVEKSLVPAAERDKKKPANQQGAIASAIHESPLLQNQARFLTQLFGSNKVVIQRVLKLGKLTVDNDDQFHQLKQKYHLGAQGDQHNNDCSYGWDGSATNGQGPNFFQVVRDSGTNPESLFGSHSSSLDAYRQWLEINPVPASAAAALAEAAEMAAGAKESSREKRGKGTSQDSGAASSGAAKRAMGAGKKERDEKVSPAEARKAEIEAKRKAKKRPPKI